MKNNKTKKIINLLDTIKHYLNKGNVDNVEILIEELNNCIREYKKERSNELQRR